MQGMLRKDVTPHDETLHIPDRALLDHGRPDHDADNNTAITKFRR
jgi:hypothetical protein